MVPPYGIWLVLSLSWLIWLHKSTIEILKDEEVWWVFGFENLAKKWIRKQLENQSKWDILLGFIGISSSFEMFAIQDEAEKEKYIHILD